VFWVDAGRDPMRFWQSRSSLQSLGSALGPCAFFCSVYVTLEYDVEYRTQDAE